MGFVVLFTFYQPKELNVEVTGKGNYSFIFWSNYDFVLKLFLVLKRFQKRREMVRGHIKNEI